MKKLVYILVTVLLVLTACTGTSRHPQLLADACNKCYDTLPSDSILHEVADYYDRYGSANEQVRAHYLLGCAYRDLGEAPQALQCYQDAASLADGVTTLVCQAQWLVALWLLPWSIRRTTR